MAFGTGDRARRRYSLPSFPPFGCAISRPRRTACSVPPQLPALLRRTAHLPDWHLDANRGTVLAGLPYDGLLGSARHGGIRRPDRGPPPGAFGGGPRRST